MGNGIKISWMGFKCSLTSAKRSIYRAANAVFGKIGGIHACIYVNYFYLYVIFYYFLSLSDDE